MSFPTSPTDGQTYNSYIYNATLGVWKKDVASKDDMFPIGMLYTQYPGESSPIDLGWPGTWTNISSNFAGDFFRAEGGEALAFDGGEQSDDNKSHSHSGSTGSDSHSHTITKKVADAGAYEGANLQGGVVGGSHPDESKTTSSNTHSHSVTIDNSGGIETRPVNRTIRIWKRTA